MAPDEPLHQFARGPHGYRAAAGEAYVTAVARASNGSGCSFHRDDVYAIDPAAPGVVRISAGGHATRLTALPATPTGIAFDQVGDFGHRLLVTAGSAVYAVDCTGQVTTLTSTAPALEGGIVVAPESFGDFGGELVATDELTGEIFAVDAAGHTTLIAHPDLPAGGDIGVESAGFVPAGLGRGHAYVADRATPGNPHPGTGSILRASLRHLRLRGVSAGDLLVVTEGGARTARVRCDAAGCGVREVAVGPAIAHVEGHLAFLPRGA
jgi:hypothetical protein